MYGILWYDIWYTMIYRVLYTMSYTRPIYYDIYYVIYLICDITPVIYHYMWYSMIPDHIDLWYTKKYCDMPYWYLPYMVSHKNFKTRMHMLGFDPTTSDLWGSVLPTRPSISSFMNIWYEISFYNLTAWESLASSLPVTLAQAVSRWES